MSISDILAYFGRLNRLAPPVLVPSLPRRDHLGEADHTLPVDKERPPVGEAPVDVEHPVRLGDRAVRIGSEPGEPRLD